MASVIPHRLGELQPHEGPSETAERTQRRSTAASFNPTRDRLKPTRWASSATRSLSFNPTRDRLKPIPSRVAVETPRGFNPTRDRLKHGWTVDPRLHGAASTPRGTV